MHAMSSQGDKMKHLEIESFVSVQSLSYWDELNGAFQCSVWSPGRAQHCRNSRYPTQESVLLFPFSVRAFSTKWNSSKLLISLKISSKSSLLWKGEKKNKKQETSHLFLLHLPPLCLQVLLGVSLQNHVYMQWVLLLVNNIAIAEPP